MIQDTRNGEAVINIKLIKAIKEYFIGLFRPWKFISFIVGTTFFVWGAFYWRLPTWDVGVSIFMSVLCYLLAPLSMKLAIEAIKKHNRFWLFKLVISLMLVYFVGSGSYEIYNTIRMGQHPVTYWENLFFSIPVTIIAGLIWQFDGSFKDLIKTVILTIKTSSYTSKR